MLGFMTFIGRGINTLEILTLRTTFPHSFPKVESEHERSSLWSVAKSLWVNGKCNIITVLTPGQGPLGRYDQLYCLVEVLLASHRTRCSEAVFLQACLSLRSLQCGPKVFNTRKESGMKSNLWAFCWGGISGVEISVSWS